VWLVTCVWGAALLAAVRLSHAPSAATGSAAHVTTGAGFGTDTETAAQLANVAVGLLSKLNELKTTGHKTVLMTERYAHLASETVRTAVAVLDGVSQNRYAERERV